MQKPVYVVMGVAGCGKTTIGKLLANEFKIPFFEGDEFHPAENIMKMKNGIPLDDNDRSPWLKILHETIRTANYADGGVLSCSALKEKYRKTLLEGNLVKFVYLKVSAETIQKRFKQRKDHFMPASLIKSQFDSLEEPENAIVLNANHSTEEIMTDLHNQLHTENSDIAVIGLGVMGTSLARNFANRGFQVTIFDVIGKIEKGQEFIKDNPESSVYPAADLLDLVRSLKKPRKILLMITAGDPVDQVLESLKPILDPQDIIIDAGNSNFMDSEKRHQYCRENSIEFIGLGVSGGEEGALKGPSLMMGATNDAKDSVITMFNAIAAKDRDNEPCFTHAGTGGAGHFVKMVHNGIEYAEMQLIAESYSLLKWTKGFDNEKIGNIFFEWNKQLSESYLLGISADILKHKTNGQFTIDSILDAAGNKGTGRWVVEAALQLGIPIPSIEQALTARFTSALKAERKLLNPLYSFKPVETETPENFENSLKTSLFVARLLNHIQGLQLIQAASNKYGWNTNLVELLNAWKGGCIIRSELLYVLSGALAKHDFSNPILSNSAIVSEIEANQASLLNVLETALKSNAAVPVFSATLQYLLATVNEWSSANMIQAQRDYFGAHRYQSVNDPSGPSHHTIWKA